MHEGLWYEIARDRRDDRLRDAAARLAAQADRRSLRARAGQVLLRWGHALAGADEPRGVVRGARGAVR